jgi:hypothetical protein
MKARRSLNALSDELVGKNLHLGRGQQVTGGGIMQETVTFSGTIIGEGQRVECKVRATKSLLDEDPSARPLFSDYTVMESDVTDKLPDGNYDLLTQSSDAVILVRVGPVRVPVRKQHMARINKFGRPTQCTSWEASNPPASARSRKRLIFSLSLIGHSKSGPLQRRTPNAFPDR